MKSLRLAAVAAILVATAAAQTPILLSASATQNPLPVGAVGSFTVEATVPCNLVSGCGIIEVRQGSPTGPVVYSPFICPLILINVGPGNPWTVQWPGSTTPGTYYARIDYRDNATFTLQPPAWFPVRIDDPNSASNGPVLTSSGSITGGATTTFNLSDPANAGATYIFAASQTTNTGFYPVASTHVALDMDFVFNLSYPLAWPGIFNNFVGNLDANGDSNNVSINVPLGVINAGGPAAVQAGVLGTGGITVSNCLTFNSN